MIKRPATRFDTLGEHLPHEIARAADREKVN
jgi:hypothetical protein